MRRRLYASVTHAACERCAACRASTSGITTSRRRRSSGGWAWTRLTSTSLFGSCAGLGMSVAWDTNACHAACCRPGSHTHAHAAPRP
eukprot:1684338-Prymnesium_polylepis.1